MQKKIRNTEDSVWVVQIYEENAVEKKRFETETAAVSWAANFAREVNSKAGSDFHDLTFLDLLLDICKKFRSNWSSTQRMCK